jgi:poly(3-hydroxybutyrate) depolymerase
MALWRLCLFALIALPAPASPAPLLPALTLSRGVTISGISSGADFAASLLLAASDIITGAGIFAGQAPLCAVSRFAGEAQSTCGAQPADRRGPGCGGLASTGAAPCRGCDAGLTVAYDHCKHAALALHDVDVPQLLGYARAAAAAGALPPLAALAGARVFLYRGALDSVYEDGSVNATAAFFSALLREPAAQLAFVADVPSQHCQPTADPWLSRASCGVNAPWAPPAMENCGFDGAGAALQHFAAGALSPPPPGARADAANLRAFDQDAYANGTVWAGLASTGFVYVPRACAAGAACALHVAFHGCGMAAVFPAMNTSFVLHSFYNEWADANNLVILYPQGGGFAERNMTAPTAQLAGGCWDGYGQTGSSFASCGGPQVVAVRNMILALGGPAFAPPPCAPAPAVE